MFRRAAAIAALTAAGLAAAAPIASATDGPTAPNDGGGNGNVQLLNGINVLPVQACGLGVPILSGVLDSPDGTCAVGNDGADVNEDH